MPLAELLDWRFNPFSVPLDDLTILPMMMFRHLNLLSLFAIPEPIMRTFVLTLRLACQPNPYHNFTHAFDVTHAMFFMLCACDLQRWLRPIDKLSLMTACLCHDVAHPGVNNAFLVATSSPIALTHNDISVLENHHCATAFRIMGQPDIDLLSILNATDRVDFRKSMITCILATDMARHQVSVFVHFLHFV
jgi:hypothetical protein